MQSRRSAESARNMAYRVELSQRAERDLDRITEYITNRLHNGAAASAFMDELLDKLEKLSGHPTMYEEARDPLLKLRGYRRIPLGNYLALYLVDEAAKAITVTNIFYGKQRYIDLI